MKITHLFAAALMVAGIGVSAEASAQRYDGGYNQDVRYDRGDWHDRGDHYDRRDDRRWGGERRHGWNNRRSHCRVVYRHHRRVTICR